MSKINQQLFETKAVSKATDQLMSATQTERTITSLKVAELTGKEHKEVLRVIRNILSRMDEINQRNFTLVEYTDTKGEKRPMYRLTKAGCLCLMMQN